MIDGIHFHERVILVALGIDAQGNKHVLGLREGSTESHAGGALAALRPGRSRAGRRSMPAVGDRRRQGAAQSHRRMLRRSARSSSAARSTSGATSSSTCPKRCTPAWAARCAMPGTAPTLRWPASNCSGWPPRCRPRHPGAAASLREGLEETLTVQGLGIGGALYRTLRTTNPIENLNGSIAHYTRNVKRWKDGQMTLRWVAGALSDAKHRFRKLRGYRDMKTLLAALAASTTDTKRSERKAA